MTRLYYDCPIEAAYMAKNFGVKFACGNILADDNNYNTVIFYECDGYYIHPDSEHIFNLKEGDLVYHDMSYSYDNISQICVELSKGGYGNKILKSEFNELVKKGHISFVQITQRDSKAFIMPKKVKS